MGGSNFVTPSFVPDFPSDGLLEAPVAIGGTGTVVAPVAGKRIFVFAAHLSAGAAGAFAVQDVAGTIGAAGGATIAQTGTIAVVAGSQVVLPWIGYPWWTCAPGDSLVFAFATAAPIGGRIVYMQG